MADFSLGATNPPRDLVPAVPSASLSDQRLYLLDWLRILAFATLVLFHIGMYYVSWDYHVKSPFAGPDLVPWMRLTGPWRMSLIFMVSGAATAHMLSGGPTLALVRRRSAFLLLPLLCGMVLVVPPQSYFEVVQKFGYSGNYFEFLCLYFGNYRGFCGNGHCLDLPTWNHLWFLPYLWVYTLLACFTLAAFPNALHALSRLVDIAFRGIGLMVVPAVFLFVVRLTLLQRYPSTHALWGDWFNHLMYLAMFTLGAAFAASRTQWEHMASVRWQALLLAISFWAILVFVRPSRPAQHVVIAVYQWTALVAAFGFARRHLNRDSFVRVRLTEAVFPVYILHQTVIIVGSQVMLPLRLAPALEGPILVVATFSLSYLGYELVKRSNLLRPWFGLRPRSASLLLPASSGA